MVVKCTLVVTRCVPLYCILYYTTVLYTVLYHCIIQDTGIQHWEVSTNECAVGFGLYEDDSDTAEWIQCANEDYKVWSHAECLEMCKDAYVCVICETLLL